MKNPNRSCTDNIHCPRWLNGREVVDAIVVGEDGVMDLSVSAFSDRITKQFQILKCFLTSLLTLLPFSIMNLLAATLCWPLMM